MTLRNISLAKTRNVLHEKPELAGSTPLVGIHENFVVLDYDSGMKEGREGIPKIMKKLTP
jgi:hypothetical protein